MKYTILWFDDMRDYLDSIDQDMLCDLIRSWGFEPSLLLVDDPAEFIAHRPFNGIDLIVVDYNLGDNQPHGETFIDEIRKNNVLTEIVFYSANPGSQLWDAIRRLQLEGVFVSSKDGIVPKIENVARQSLKKLLDLNNVRGLIMAEVGDLDQQIDSVLRKASTAIPKEALDKIFAKFGADLERQGDQRTEAIKAFYAAPSIEAMISFFDSSKRWDNLRRLQKADGRLKNIDLENASDEILFPRNCLAHGMPTMDGDNQVFAFGKGSFIYNEASSVMLRQNILKYKAKLSAIDKLI